LEGTITNFIYLICIALFIIGLKKLSHPDSARTGNLLAAAGMIGALIVTLFAPLSGGDDNYPWIAGGIIIGTVIGLVAAKKIKMTAMPEMDSIFNGLGGACAMLLSIVEFYNHPSGAPLLSGQIITTFFALFVGSISFTGSLVAYGKLDGFLRDSLVPPAPKVVNILLLLIILAVSGYTMLQPELNFTYVMAVLVLSLIYGVTFVTPIGGGDMPVVISLLNSFTGLGAALAGLIYGNQVMIVGGVLVGAAGTILTMLMCKAMNRSLINVIIGGFTASGGSAAESGDQVAKVATYSDTAIMLKYAQKVMVVPGYGMAVAQAQHTVHDLEKTLEEEGVSLKYAIHPVAGRMPGHMNVLLAEADVPYPKLLDLEEANKEFSSTDVVLVIGANDVVNPAAKTDTSSPIYGMPILDVEKAKHVIVLKRSMNPGYAGIQNQLFFGERTRMLFGDAKSSLSKLIEEMNNV
jgi:NAD(P) transhydrogenase subunit beta